MSFEFNVRKREKVRLLSDHHVLSLERFCLKSQSWQELAKQEFERLNFKSLSEWLKRFSLLKRSEFSLVLETDLFEFLPLNQPALEKKPADTFFEVLPHGQAYQAILLEQASINVYTEACKTCKIKIFRISPQNYPDANLLPWREQLEKKRKYKQFLQLSALPLSALVLCFAWNNYEESILARLKTQNQNLTQQLHLNFPNQPTYPLSLALNLMHSLHFDIYPIEEVKIQNGQVNLSGRSQVPDELSAMLDQLKISAFFKPNSLQDWSLHQTHERDAWQASFELAVEQR